MLNKELQGLGIYLKEYVLAESVVILWLILRFCLLWSNFSPEKVYEPTLSLTFYVHSIAANHTYKCQ